MQRKAALIAQAPDLASRLGPALETVPDAIAFAQAQSLAAERSKKNKKKKSDKAAADGSGSGSGTGGRTSTEGGSESTSAAAVATGESSPPETPTDPADWQAALGGGIFTEAYRVVGVDLCHMRIAAARLHAAGLRADRPTLVLSECVLTYMAPAHADAVMTWAGSYFADAVLANYEQIIPSDAFGVFMQSHFMKQRECCCRKSGRRKADEKGRVKGRVGRLE